MITRIYDATLLNLVANKPLVRDTFGLHLHDPAPLDFTELVSMDTYTVLSNGIDAFCIMDKTSPSVYDGHSVFDTTCRGRDAIKTGKAFIQWMWDNTSAKIIIGKTPVENKKARWFNRQIGFKSDGFEPFDGVHGAWDAEWFSIMRPVVNITQTKE